MKKLLAVFFALALVFTGIWFYTNYRSGKCWVNTLGG